MEILRFADGAGPLADADAAATEAPLPEGWAGREALAAALALAGCGGGREDETALPTQGLPAPFAIRDQARTDAGLMPTRPSAASMQRLAASTTLRTPGPAELMDWAEAAYADYFPGHESDRVEEPYVYRHYTATGNYLGVADGQVYLLGTVSGGALLRVGSLADFAPRVYGEPRPIAAADADAARALLQAQFSALPHEIDAVRRRGFTAWLEEQMTAPRSITGVAWLDANGYRNTSVKRHYFTQERPAIWMIWPQLWLAPDAVRMRAALALSEFFVVSSLGASGNWVNYAMAAYWDLLVEHAFGSSWRS